MLIGIDLGTTFSVIAVNGRVQVTPGYPEPRYIEECDISIIPDPFGNYIIPSVLFEDLDRDGDIVVGALAKEATLDGAEPVMFSKRNMGTDIVHQSGGKHLSAREAAREILIYLKGIAEEALGERVDRAVITHPAYFDPAMKEETGLAARDAGFDFDADKHLLMEPVAAALAYTRTDNRDPLRILTYDLGGGTFDVTVMERRKGVVTIKAFGGNRLLGGFNFDRALARWLLKDMQDRGVQLSLDEHNSADRAKWARLLRLAEDAKIRLANARTPKMPVQIKEQAVFDDDLGRPINLMAQITREQFTQLIQEDLDSTISGQGGDGETRGCNAVLAEAGLNIDQVDEILLVGGSTAGPWVAETINKAWGREPQLFEPDMCVASGAAINAASLPQEVRGASCRVELDVPKQSVLDMFNVAGRVVATGSAEACVGLQALLACPTGKTLQKEINPDGAFLFEDVELQAESVSKFGLTVADSEGRKIAEHHFDILHSAEGETETTGVLTVLPKPLYIEVLQGRRPLADEGVTLPAHCEVELTRTNDEDSIEIRLFQEDDPIGAVVIEKVPKEAPIGARVKLSVDVSRNNRMTGRAAVFSRLGAVAAEAPVNIRIPPIQVPDTDSLKVELGALEAERAERIELERDANARMVMQAKGDKLRQDIERLLNDPTPDRQEVWLALRRLRAVVNPPKDEMEPALDEFERVVLRIKEVISSQPSDPQLQSQGKIVDRLEAEGRMAHSKKDRKAWGQINGSLISLLHKLEKPTKEDSGGDDVAPTALQKLFAQMQLDQTRQMLRAKEGELLQSDKLERVQRQVDRLRTDIEASSAEIDQLDDNTEPKAAQARLQLIYFQKIKPLEDRIQTLGVDVK